MKKRTPDRFWFPWWPDKWIFGSMRIECTAEERGIWLDLYCIASKDNGFIRANEETPYPISQLAGMLIIPEKTLREAIEKFIKLKDKDGNGKLTRMKDGTLYVTKWDKYQFTERHKRRIKDSQGDTFSPEYKTFIPCPDEYKSMATKKGLVRVSRLIVAIAIGRSLKKGEQVHHKDEDDKNDDVINLMLFQGQKEHLRYQHGHEAEYLWRGDTLSSDEIEDIGVKIKDIYNILNNSTLNNNKINKSKLDNTTWEKLDAQFEKWFKRYPISKDVGKAKSKWLNLVVGEKVNPQELEDALTGYINCLNNEQTDREFIKHAKTFLYNGNKKKKIESTWRPYIKYSDPKYKSKPPL